MNRPEGMPSADRRTTESKETAKYLMQDENTIRLEQEVARLREKCERLRSDVEIENNAKCQIIASKTMEINRLRELIPQAWEAGAKRMQAVLDPYLPNQLTMEEWMKSKGLA